MSPSKQNFLLVKKALSRIFFLLALLFFTYALWKSKSDFIQIIADTDKQRILISIVIWGLAHLAPPFFASNLIKKTGYTFPYLSALNIHIRLLPAKYIPGGVWHTIGRIGMMKSIGIPPRAITALVFLENLIPPSITIGLGSLIISQHPPTITSPWMPTIALISLLALIIGLILTNKKILNTENKITTADYTKLITIIIFFWATTSLSFITFLSAFQSIEILNNTYQATGIYLFSWGTGFLSFFAPQGIGVFETVAANLMTSNIPVEKLILILALFRIVVMIGDMTVWIIWLIIKKAIRTQPLILKQQNPSNESTSNENDTTA